jgi:hypothetical protein
MPDNTPLLRTLSPALRGLARSLRTWIEGPRRAKLSTMARAGLEGLAADLERQSDALGEDRPLLVIMLMGGTGVGKSTLLNALAGGKIAQASFTRPTTRDPVVYFHQSIKHERLDPALRHCRLVPHDRPQLEQKILVDTPDLDSNDLSNRDKLLRLLPIADIVLYVGSQEKYHDQLGWELFLKQRKRRAFAFVLNKWDRCTHASSTGLRPDEDLLRDLKAEGFQNPQLFRTCAQLWVDASGDGLAEAAAPAVPPGEQFRDLVNWLELGLTRLEVEAIKARGVNQLLQHLQEALTAALPPDLTEAAERTRTAWAKPLGEDADTTADILLNTLEPNQREIEHHFALEGQRRFSGLMAGYLSLWTRLKYAGSNLRARIPFMPNLGQQGIGAPAWDLTLFTRICSDVAANRQLDARGKALSNHLLVEADSQGFPVDLLTDPVEAVSVLDWRQRYALILSEVLQHVEQQWTKPTGSRRGVQAVVVFLANWLPVTAMLAALLNLLWKAFDPYNQGLAKPSIFDIFLPFIVVLVVLILLHVLVELLLPLRWPAIRGEFHKQLIQRLHQELESVYGPVPMEAAQALLLERKQVEKLLAETGEVASWLDRREQSANIAGLYGN